METKPVCLILASATACSADKRPFSQRNGTLVSGNKPSSNYVTIVDKTICCSEDRGPLLSVCKHNALSQRSPDTHQSHHAEVLTYSSWLGATWRIASTTQSFASACVNKAVHTISIISKRLQSTIIRPSIPSSI